MALGTIKPRLSVIDQRTAKVPPKVADRFYDSPEWRAVRDAVLKDKGRKCCMCGRTDGRMFVDHIHELKDGGAALDPSNCQVVCGACHTAKTAKVRAERMATRYK